MFSFLSREFNGILLKWHLFLRLEDAANVSAVGKRNGRGCVPKGTRTHKRNERGFHLSEVIHLPLRECFTPYGTMFEQQNSSAFSCYNFSLMFVALELAVPTFLKIQGDCK